jgi:hypothetical protein
MISSCFQDVPEPNEHIRLLQQSSAIIAFLVTIAKNLFIRNKVASKEKIGQTYHGHDCDPVQFCSKRRHRISFCYRKKVCRNVDI